MSKPIELSEFVNPTPNSPDEFPVIAGIDRERAKINSGEDREFFLDMLALFIAEFEHLGETVRAEIDRGDLTAAKRRLHNLRGNAGNLGAMDLMNSAQSLELSIPNTPPDLNNQIEELCSRIEALVKAATPWLSRQKKSATSTDPIDIEKLSALREALSRRNLLALTLYNELEATFCGHHDQESLHDLQQAIRQLRFEDAVAWLDEHAPPTAQ